MGSMSYCVFRNTAEEFRQCLEKISEISTLHNLSAGESSAARDLREMAETYIEHFDQIDEETMLCEEQQDES